MQSSTLINKVTLTSCAVLLLASWYSPLICAFNISAGKTQTSFLPWKNTQDLATSRSFVPTSTRISSTTKLFSSSQGPSKRRRRKDGKNKKADDDDKQIPSSSSDIEDLPDFDLFEDDDIAASSSSPQQTVMKSSTTNPVPKKKASKLDENDPLVLEAMRSTSQSSSSSSSSTKDLLRSRNRELEQKLVVNEVTQDLPSLADYRKNKSTGGGGGVNKMTSMTEQQGDMKIGKKAARAAERRAAAIAAEEAERDANQKGFSLSSIPFLGIDENEKFVGVKLLEKGTWAGIFMLLAWEIYINSPLFDRAAPLAPIVYTTPP